MKTGDKAVVIRDFPLSYTTDRERYGSRIASERKIRVGDIITIRSVEPKTYPEDEDGPYVVYESAGGYINSIPMTHIAPSMTTTPPHKRDDKQGYMVEVILDDDGGKTTNYAPYVESGGEATIKKGDFFVVTEDSMAVKPPPPISDWNPHGFQDGDWARVIMTNGVGEKGYIIQISSVSKTTNPSNSYAIYYNKKGICRSVLLSRIVPANSPAPRQLIVPILCSLPIFGVFAMPPILESLGTDPMVHNSIVALIVSSTGFVISRMGLSTMKASGTLLAQWGDRRRKVNQESQVALMAAAVKQAMDSRKA